MPRAHRALPRHLLSVIPKLDLQPSAHPTSHPAPGHHARKSKRPSRACTGPEPLKHWSRNATVPTALHTFTVKILSNRCLPVPGTLIPPVPDLFLQLGQHFRKCLKNKVVHDLFIHGNYAGVCSVSGTGKTL